MILGLPIETFTLLHVLVSLVGIVCGFMVVAGLLAGRHAEPLTAVFLATTALTSLTGFLYPVTAFGPRHVVGIVSMALLAAAAVGLYGFRLAGAWRYVYAVGALLALYLNTVAAIVQAFRKVPVLAAWAASEAVPQVEIVQAGVAVAFVVLAVLALRRGGARPGPASGRRGEERDILRGA
jgi:hypothetical protein